MGYEPMHHKYRPQTFADLVGQEAIATTLSNAIVQERIAPAYLFTGPRGTGKTSSARILAKSLNCIAGENPTPSPCGQCAICQAIIKGSALDVIEIDAASNTGVDNIREIIERAQFAPVQCRYKIYVIDECLVGSSLVQTSRGLMRIDNPDLLGKKVLSYNETTNSWEYKKVTRWLERGQKKTLLIHTKQGTIQCTPNHLIRTEKGWISAENLTAGMKILSPVSVDAEPLSKNTEQIIAAAALYEDTNSKGINSDKKITILPPFWSKQNLSGHSVPAAVVRNWQSQNSCKKKALVFRGSNPIGKSILTKKAMEYGISEPKNSWEHWKLYPPKNWDLSMELCSGMPTLPNQIPTVASPVWDGLTVNLSENGQNIKQSNYPNFKSKLIVESIKDTEIIPSYVTPSVIPSYVISLKPLDLTIRLKLFLLTGWKKLPVKESPGGIWMMVLLSLVLKEVLIFNFILKDTPNQKISFWPIGLPPTDTWLKSENIKSLTLKKFTTTYPLKQKAPENSLTILNNTQSLPWTTNLVTVESVTLAGIEAVYDLEVEDNHNFVANGLLVHNCHMLSAAAFNALLKTLEEPPERVVFVLATTDPQRVLPTIISRCQRFDYRRIPLASMVAHLTHIAQAEAIALKPEALTLVAQLANGGLRDAESLLDQLSLLPGPVTPEQVWDLVGTVPEQDLLKLLQAIAADNPEQLLDIGRQILNRGREPLVVLQNLASFYLNLLIARTAPQRTDLVAVTASTWQALVQLAQSWPINTILQGQQCLREAEVQLRNTTQPQLWLEVTLLGLLPSAVGNAPAVSTASAVAPSPMPVSPPPSPPVIPEPASPEESVAAVPSPSTPTPLPSPATTDLAQVWQDCLPYLSPAAQALLKVHGSLVHLDTSLAQIGMRSDPLLRMAQQHQADVEVALRRICQRPLQVKFILQMAMAPAVNPSQPVAKPESPQLVPVPSPPPPPKVQALPTPKPSVSTPAPVPPTVNPPSSPSPETETVSQPQDLHKAMERLAKNFEGQWIRAEDSDPTPPSEEHKPMITGRPLPPTLATDDEDIPF